MLSTTHAIFRGLQAVIKDALSDLPIDTSPKLVAGLTDAHRKLSDYYYKFDESPLYTWATLLDPRISYSGLQSDYEDDDILLEHLEKMKTELREHFHTHYAGKHTSCGVVQHEKSSAPSTSCATSGPKINFMAQYKQAAQVPLDKLEEYFKLPQEDIKTCDPI
ncbi:hypothetical protein H0H81_003023 [Sphagnurus paluster]|uniref:Uncharacterized protein n=1 Tax=Sphagnurus paluster TaxID=117069 RepID=A0A9P7GFD6_9AGAR|nr:hypothetical protein H0H81_003023 [Sphagnurus paluster]